MWTSLRCSTCSGACPGGRQRDLDAAQRCTGAASHAAYAVSAAPATAAGRRGRRRRARTRAHPVKAATRGTMACMSALKDRLRADLTTAIKARDEVRSSTLRMVLTAITNAEVAGKEARELSDDDVIGRALHRGQEAPRGGHGVRRRRPRRDGRQGARRGRRDRRLPARAARPTRRSPALVTATVAELGVGRRGHEGDGRVMGVRHAAGARAVPTAGPSPRRYAASWASARRRPTARWVRPLAVPAARGRRRCRAAAAVAAAVAAAATAAATAVRLGRRRRDAGGLVDRHGRCRWRRRCRGSAGCRRRCPRRSRWPRNRRGRPRSPVTRAVRSPARRSCRRCPGSSVSTPATSWPDRRREVVVGQPLLDDLHRVAPHRAGRRRSRGASSM